MGAFHLPATDFSNAALSANPAVRSNAPAPKKAPAATPLSPAPNEASKASAPVAAMTATATATLPGEVDLVVMNCHRATPARSSRAGRETCLRRVSHIAITEMTIATNAPATSVNGFAWKYIAPPVVTAERT